jgi:hypothetical protein
VHAGHLANKFIPNQTVFVKNAQIMKNNLSPIMIKLIENICSSNEIKRSFDERKARRREMFANR